MHGLKTVWRGRGSSRACSLRRLTIKHTDRHGTQMPCANSRTILLLVHRLLSSVHHAGVACYTDRHNTARTAQDSIIGAAHRLGSGHLCASIEAVCADHGRLHIGVAQQFLYRANIVTVFKQVRRNETPKSFLAPFLLRLDASRRRGVMTFSFGPWPRSARHFPAPQKSLKTGRTSAPRGRGNGRLHINSSYAGYF